MKTLKQVMGDLGGYMPKPEGEQNFVKKHVVDVTPDANGNGDEVFKAAKVKVSDRPGERHGYTDADDDKVNEATEVHQMSDAEAGEKDWAKILKKYGRIGAKSQEPAEKKEESVEESTDTVVRDKSGKVVSWSHYGDWKKMKGADVVVDKSGAKHSPSSQARHLARMAMGKAVKEGVEVELDEKTLTAAEKKKREEIAQAMERENPGMDMGRKMAIATAAAKRVAEEVVVEAKEEKKKPAVGKSVPASGVYDSIPLGITVTNEGLEVTDAGVALLEMFASLDEEEQQMFVEMLESNSELISEIAQEAK